MKAKDYLRDIAALRHRIINNAYEIHSLREMSDALSEIEGAPEQIHLRRDKLLAEIRQYKLVVADAEALIYRLDMRYSDILYRRYLCDMPWQLIADDMHYDLRWVFKLHGQALQEFDKFFK